MFASAVRRYTGEALEAWRARGVSTLVTAATDEPVTVDTLKRHSRLSDASIDYDLLPLRIQAARQWVEAYTGRVMMTSTWAYTVDWLADGLVPLLLPRVPLIDVTSIKTYDAEDVETTVSAANYRVDISTQPGRVLLDTSVGYWAANPRYYGGVVVTYRAGYGATEDAVPAIFRHAILLLAAEMTERLEGGSDLKVEEIPFGIRALLDPYRMRA